MIEEEFAAVPMRNIEGREVTAPLFACPQEPAQAESYSIGIGEVFENARLAAAAAATAAAARANAAVETLRNSVGQGNGDPCEVLLPSNSFSESGKDAAGGRLISVDLWSPSDATELERVRAAVEAELQSDVTMDIVDNLGALINSNAELCQAVMSSDRMPLRVVPRGEVEAVTRGGAKSPELIDPFTEVLGERLAAIELTAESAAKCANHCNQELQRLGFHSAAVRLATLEQRVELIMSEVTHEKNIRENVIGTFAKRLDTVVQLVERVIGDTTMRVSEQVLPVLSLPVKEEELECEQQSGDSPTQHPDSAQSPVTRTARSEEFLYAQTQDVQDGAAKDMDITSLEASVRRVKNELSSEVQRLDDRLDILAISRAADSKRLEDQGIQLHAYADELKSQGECVTSAIEAMLQWMGENESSGFGAALERFATHYVDNSDNATRHQDHNSALGAVRERLDNAAALGAVRDRLDMRLTSTGSSNSAAPLGGISRMSSNAGSPGLQSLVAQAEQRIKRFSSIGSNSAPSVVDLPRGRVPVHASSTAHGISSSLGSSAPSVVDLPRGRLPVMPAPVTPTLTPTTPTLTPTTPLSVSAPPAAPTVAHSTTYGGGLSATKKAAHLMPVFGMTQASSSTPLTATTLTAAPSPTSSTAGGSVTLEPTRPCSPRAFSADARNLSPGQVVHGLRGRQVDTRRVQSSSPIAERRSLRVTRTNQYAQGAVVRPGGSVTASPVPPGSPASPLPRVLNSQTASRALSPQHTPAPSSYAAPPAHGQMFVNRARATTYGSPASSLNATAGAPQIRLGSGLAPPGTAPNLRGGTPQSPACSISAAVGSTAGGSLSAGAGTSKTESPLSTTTSLPPGSTPTSGAVTPTASPPIGSRPTVEPGAGAAHERAPHRPFRRLVSHSIGLSPD
mmetsp:Transcript_86191/g.150361  ORF Transcript_86191/g.150361 Transcript_86191/m.150361 type:complete len:909 (-) Transcript_86191:40-2766(-)